MKVSIPVAEMMPQLPPCLDPHADPCRFPRFSSPISFLNLRAFVTIMALMFMLQAGSGPVAAQSNKADTCVCDFDAEKDYFPVKLNADFATKFQIEYKKSYKKITVQSSSGPVVTYAYLCGTPRPSEAAESDAVVQIPIDAASVTSTTFLPFVNYIGKGSTLDYVSATETDMPSCLRKMFADGKLATGFNLASKAEQIIELALDRTGQYPDVIFADNYNYGSVKNKVSELFGTHTKAMLLSETSESHPLGPVEWLEVVAALYNAEPDARYVVSSIQQRYNCVKNLVQANPPAQRKKVMWLTYSTSFSMYLGSSCPGSYYCQMIEDAGGEILTSSVLNHTTVLAMAEEADVWIYPDGNFFNSTQYNTPLMDGELGDLFSNTKVVQEKQVFDYLGTHALDWFDDRYAEPDVLLMDLVQAFWGSEYIAASREKSYLRNVFTEPAADQGPRDPALCTDIDQKHYTEWLTGPCFTSGPDPGAIKPVLCQPPTTPPSTDSNDATVMGASWMMFTALMGLVFGEFIF